MTTPLPSSTKSDSNGTAAGVVERGLEALLAHRFLLFFMGLTLSLTIAMWGAASKAEVWKTLGIVGLVVVWYLAWIQTSWRKPLFGRTLMQGLFTVLGAVLLGVLALQNFAFVIVCVPFMPRFFVTMPLRWSFPAVAIMLVPVDFAFRSLTLRDPSAYGWVIVVRLGITVIIGSFLQHFTRQMEQRRLLVEQLARAERRTGQLEERQRFARDIHDTLAQGFAGIVVHLQTAELERTRDAALADQHAKSALGVARQSLEEARRMMGAMLPEALDGRDLADALARITSDWCVRTGIAAETVITGDVRPLDRDLEVALLRIAQEALTNVWKHAQAKSTTVTLSYLDDVVMLDVRDDGVGMTGDGKRSGGTGVGLEGMRERVELLGGTLAVESSEGDGTTISATIPAVPSDTATWPNAS